MAQIQYTPYFSKTTTYTPNFEVDDYIPTIRSKPKEEIQLAPLPTTTVAVNPLPQIVKGITDNSKKYDVGNMQHIIDAFENAGISIRITSGVRPGAMTKSGNRSHHSFGNAIDITPNFAEGET